jgi:hypothetical protein
MGSVSTVRLFEVTGADRAELEHRLDRLCTAIRLFEGSIVRVTRTHRDLEESATVLYSIPPVRGAARADASLIDLAARSMGAPASVPAFPG